MEDKSEELRQVPVLWRWEQTAAFGRGGERIRAEIHSHPGGCMQGLTFFNHL